MHLAAGFCGHGFAIGPVVGRLLSEWLLDGKPSIDVSAFRLDRFRPAVARRGRCGSQTDVVVIGGGVIGTAVAYYLARAGKASP